MNKAIQLSYNDEFEYRCRCAASAGFQSVAVAYTEVVGKSDREWAAITADILRILGENGLTCVQTHPHYYYPLLTSDELDEIVSFCIEVGLPVTLSELGVTEVTDEKLLAVAKAATVPGETIHTRPFEVTAEKVVAAMKAADAYGNYLRCV